MNYEGGFGQQRGTRGSPEWWLNLMTAFEALRDEECGEVWRAAEDRYRQRANRAWRFKNNEYTLKVVRPPRVYSMVHAADANLLYNRAKFFARPTSEEYIQLAGVAEPLANGMWQRYVADEELRLCVRDCVKYGRMWARVGYEDDYAKAAKARAKRRRTAARSQSNPLAGVLRPNDLGVPTGPAPRGEENAVERQTYENDLRALWKKPSFRREGAWDVFFDPDATVAQKMRWCGVRILADVESVKADPRFKNIEGIDKLQPTLRLDGRSGKMSSSTKYGQRQGVLSRTMSAMTKAFTSYMTPGTAQEAYQYCELFELYVLNDDGKWGRKLVANGFDKFLADEDELYDIGCPLITGAWNGDGDTLFTTSDVEQVMTQVVEEEQLRTRLHQFMLRRANQPTLLDKKMFGTVNNIDLLSHPVLGMYALVEGNINGQPLQSGVAQLPKAWELGETMAYLGMIDKEFAQAAGLGPAQRLEAMKSDTSAAEAQNVNQASVARLSDKQATVERFCVEGVGKILGLGAQFFEAEQLAVFLGQDEVATWLDQSISAGDIQDGLHLYVEKGSMTPQSDQSRAQFYVEMLGLWKDPVLGQKIDGDEVLERLAQLRSIPDLDRLMLPNVDVDELRTQIMQMALMQGGAKSGPGAAPVEGGMQ